MFTLSPNPQTGLFIEKQRLHEIGQEIDARRLGNALGAADFSSADELSGHLISERARNRRLLATLWLRPILTALLHFVKL